VNALVASAIRMKKLAVFWYQAVIVPKLWFLS